MTNPKRDKEQDMLQAFYNLFADIDPDTPEEIEEIILATGINPDGYAAKIRKLAKATLAEQARHQIEAARHQYEGAKSRVTDDRQTLIQKIQQKLAQLDSHKRPAFAHHRNLESASDTDLQSLLDDLTYLADFPELE